MAIFQTEHTTGYSDSVPCTATFPHILPKRWVVGVGGGGGGGIFWRSGETI